MGSVGQDSLSLRMTSLFPFFWGSVSTVEDEQLWGDKERTLMEKESQEQGNGRLQSPEL